jgi:hypothetical protein
MLTAKQQRMLEVIMETVSPETPKGDHVRAYREAYRPSENMDPLRVNQLACHAKRTLYRKAETQEILRAKGLSTDRFAIELDMRLRANKSLTYQGQISMLNGMPILLEDNATRMAATTLFAEILGLKQKHMSVDMNITKNVRELVIHVNPREKPKIVGYDDIKADLDRCATVAGIEVERGPSALLSGPNEIPGDVRVDSVRQDDVREPERDNLQSRVSDELRRRLEKYLPGAKNIDAESIS